MIKESLFIICSPSKEEKGMYAEFEDMDCTVMYVNPRAESENTEWVKNSLDCGFVK